MKLTLSTKGEQCSELSLREITALQENANCCFLAMHPSYLSLPSAHPDITKEAFYILTGAP